MSLTADIVSTVSGFFAERGYPENEAVLLVKEIIEDLDSDPETWGVEKSVSISYAWHKEHAAQQSMHPTSGSLRGLEDLSTPEDNPAPEVLSTPPTCG